ncbi:MAG: SH3 domain-containing protein [Anaerolineales bacterium]
MSYTSRLSLTIIILSIVVLSCALPAITLQDSGAISTAAAQTVVAGLTQVAASVEAFPTLQQPTLTFTPEPPTLTPTFTETPTQTLTATPIFTSTPIFTFTPIVPQISVSVPTNCRIGPGKVYRMVGALLVGETAQIYGRDPTGGYWYIRNPDSSSGYCWVWGEYATVIGNVALLPVYTPPPTPTPTFTPTPSPDFVAAYTSLDTCVGWWVELRLQNTGSIPFKSIGLTVRDTVTDVVLASFTNNFTNIDGCLSSNTTDTLSVDNKRIVSAPAFNYDPSGHKIRTTIILCSDVDQSGTCVTKTINFIP